MDDQVILVSRMHKIDGQTKLKAFADISFNGVVVKGFSVVEGSKGLFVSMPRQQGKDGKWYDTVHPETEELKKQLSNVVLEAYKA